MGKTIQVSGFPSNVSVEAVKTYLEMYTGEKSIIAMKIRLPKNGGRRAFAIVQFKDTASAERIINLASIRLWYGSSYLKARKVETDIIPRPRTFMHTMENVVLHFGCQISKERFSFFWRAMNVTVNFGFGLRKLYFEFPSSGTCYKLELPYENLWQIQLHRPHGRAAKFLLIQLLGAPLIYEKDVFASESVFDDPRFNYFVETPDDQWVRTTDFTQSCCIGQSSSFCLELPYGLQLPNLRDNFAYYKENDGQFILESGSTFSSNLYLVPIIGPPHGADLPYEILFKINSLVQTGCLSGPTLDVNFFRLVDPRRINIFFIEQALEKLYHMRECCYEPVKWLNEQYRKYLTSRHTPQSPAISLYAGLVYVRRIQVTPCRVYFCGPEVNVSNRVLRNYSDDIDNFIRISFIDEDLDKVHSTDLSPRTRSVIQRRTKIYTRILSTLRNGIVIGNKKFEFLAFSSSQLRDNSAWMFASRPGLTAASIREWMGDFHEIRNVAKYAARLGQSFGSSTETLTVQRHEVQVIPDIETETSKGVKYNFSDGIGKISSDFARKVTKKCGINGFTPSAFQIRYAGYKGVVAVDPFSPMKLSLRRSMCKYESSNTKLDVLSWCKYQPCYLNRQLITLLSTLGVRDQIFEKKQTEVINDLEAMLTDPLRAQDALELMSPGENTNILKEMLLCGYKPDLEPFLTMMIQTFRASKLHELRTKARIFVPNGRVMMGCLDETRTLEYGQGFVQFSGREWDKERYVVNGKVVVAKNPCLHPGDVRVLRALDIPSLHHMVDCVVFPQKGMRPHPNECSGSDLDGDLYFVCWDPELIPPRQIDPMDYTPAPSMLLDHDVNIEEVEEYFTNYILNDSLGIIANAHTAFADKEPAKAMSDPCIELAKLFSIAVDFPKTGVPAEIPPHLHVREYPDFMEKPDKFTYESRSVIGMLFREVKDIASHARSITFTAEMARKSYDSDMEVDGFEDYTEDAAYYKGNYDAKLGNLMDYYGIKSEAEILSGSIMKMSKSFNRRRDAEAIGLAVRSLRKEVRTWFNEKSSASGEEEDDDVYAKASAWYHVTYHHSYWGTYNEGRKLDHFLSFPWCVHEKLIHIKKEKARVRVRRSSDLSPLERQFEDALFLL